jgi:hypothetical protein
MGYLHDTATSFFIPPTLFHCVTGTWSHAAGQVAGTIVKSVNDANQTSTVNIPIVVPSNSVTEKGCYLKSVEIDFEVTGAALEEVTAVFNKVTRGADTAIASVAAQTFSYDTGHDTAGERIDVDQHKMTLTLTTPVWVDNDVYFLIELTINQAGDTGVIELLGAIANVTMRL